MTPAKEPRVELLGPLTETGPYERVSRRAIIKRRSPQRCTEGNRRQGPGVSKRDDEPERGRFTRAQSDTLHAMVDVIVPADDYYVSGTDAAVSRYLERQFSSDLAGQIGHYRLGLDAVDAESEAVYDCPFTSLATDQREQLLQAIESGYVCAMWPVDPRTFFALVVGNVMEGFYGDPANGGNRNAESWRMIGFQVTD